MEKIIITFSLILASFFVNAQTNQNYEPKDSSLYLRALVSHLQYHQQLRLNDEPNTGIKTKEIFVQELPGITDKLPNNVENQIIHYINISDFRIILKEKKSITLIIISPILNSHESLFLGIGDYILKKKGRNYVQIYEGGSNFEFRYDCLNKEYRLVNKQHGGI